MLLPAGFTSREIARGGSVVGGYPWHFALRRPGDLPDAATAATSSSRTPRSPASSAAARRRSASTPTGEIERAYRDPGRHQPQLRAAARRRGAPGSPARSTRAGMIWEADPAGILPAHAAPGARQLLPRGRRGRPGDGHVYLTEDQGDGCFYRFTPDDYPVAARGRARGRGRRPRRRGRPGRGARPEPRHAGQDDPQAGARRHALQRRRGPLVRRGHRLLHDQGRPARLGLRHRRPRRWRSSTTARATPGRLAERRRQRDRLRRRATSTSARTAATWRSG